MSAVVVDTDVLSFQFKRDTRALNYDPFLAGQHWIVSFMTVAELDRWAVFRNWGPARRVQMGSHLALFAIHWPDRHLCGWWAEASQRSVAGGKPLQCADAWIAATAMALNVPLVTHNAADYAAVNGLTVLTCPVP